MSVGHQIADLIFRSRFTHSDVTRLAGVKDDTLQNWAKRKIISPIVSSPGRQGKREYSGIDLATVFVGARLVDTGFPPAAVLPMARQCILRLIGEHAKSRSKSFAFYQFPSSRDEKALADKLSFADDVADLVVVLVSKLDADIPPLMHLLPKHDLSRVADIDEPSIIVPIGAMLAKLARDAAERVR